MGKYRTRPEERPKELNCRFSNAPNRKPNHRCPARESTCHNCKKKGCFAKASRLEHGKQQEIKVNTEPGKTEGSHTDKSNKITTEMTYRPEKSNHPEKKKLTEQKKT